MKFDFTINGEAELTAALKSLEPKIAKRLMTKAMRPAAQIIRHEIQARSPIKSGQLKRSFKIRAMPRSRKRFGIEIRSEEKDFKGTFITAFQEYGTSKMPARPFMQPAFEATKDQAHAKLVEGLKQLVDEAVNESAVKNQNAR